MKKYISYIVILVLLYVVGCSLPKSYEEASKYFYDNEGSFNRTEQLLIDNKFNFGIRYYFYPIHDKKDQFEIWFQDSLSKRTVTFYVRKGFTASDSVFIPLKEKLNLHFDSFKELSDLLIKMNCDVMIFQVESLSLSDIIYKKYEPTDERFGKKIKGNWYYYSKQML